MLRVAVSSPSFSLSEVLVRELKGMADVECAANSDATRFDEDGLIAFLTHTQAEALIVGTEQVTDRVLTSCPQLRAVVKYGVGTDNVDRAALRKRKIFFGWTGGVNKRSVAELVVGMSVGHCRNVFASVDRMREGTWQKHGGRQLSQCTFGLVGFGHVGSDVAALLSSFGCPVLIHDVLDKSKKAAKLGATQVSYLEILERCDIVSFHVPLTKRTHHMFGDRQIGLCTKQPLILNTSRGAVVAFDEVVRGVQESKLSGFGADVFPSEPFANQGLSPQDGFYFTPHIGGNAAEAILAMGRSAMMHLKTYIKTR